MRTNAQTGEPTAERPANAESLLIEQMELSHRLLLALRQRELALLASTAGAGSLHRLALMRRQSTGYERSFHKALAALERLRQKPGPALESASPSPPDWSPEADAGFLALIGSVAAAPPPPHIADLAPAWSDDLV